MTGIKSASEIFLRYCKDEKNLSEKTLYAYATDINQFVEYVEKTMPGSTMNDIKKESLKAFLDGLAATCMPKTVKRKIATMKAMFTYHEQEDMIDISPFRKLKLDVQEDNSTPETMSVADVRKLFKAAYKRRDTFPYKDTYSYNSILRDIAIMELLFGTGARVSEVTGLKKSELNLEAGEITIISPGGKGRLIKLNHKELLESLKIYENTFQSQIDESDYFFINRLGKTISEQSVRFMVKKYAKIAGLKQHITPHVFRHTFAKMLIDEGMDIRHVQELLGHSSIVTTNAYVTKVDSKVPLNTGKVNLNKKVR